MQDSSIQIPPSPTELTLKSFNTGRRFSTWVVRNKSDPTKFYRVSTSDFFYSKSKTDWEWVGAKTARAVLEALEKAKNTTRSENSPAPALSSVSERQAQVTDTMMNQLFKNLNEKFKEMDSPGARQIERCFKFEIKKCYFLFFSDDLKLSFKKLQNMFDDSAKELGIQKITLFHGGHKIETMPEKDSVIDSRSFGKYLIIKVIVDPPK